VRSFRFTIAIGLLSASLGGCAGSGSLQGPPQTSDTGIANLASRRISMDQRLCPYDITVVVYGRTARLEGRVASEPSRRHAETLALGAGALKVDDQLVIDPSTGDPAKC